LPKGRILNLTVSFSGQNIIAEMADFIHPSLGPTLPGFLSPNVAKILVEKFNIKPIGTVEENIAAMMAGN
jgi:hypothetical protein